METESPSEGIERRLIGIEELSSYIGVPTPTLYTWTHLRKIPYVKIGRSVRFDRREIDLWIENCRVGIFPGEGTILGGHA